MADLMIGVGICTFNRPDFAEKSVKAVIKNCGDVIDHLAIYNDGSDPKHHGAYQRVYKPVVSHGGDVIDAPHNCGVSYAKNRLIEHLLERGCDWVILAEDDIKPLAPQAVSEYVRIAEKRGEHHYSFASHGPANLGGPVDTDGEVMYYPHSVGAWCLYSRECLENVGLFDQSMVNAFEHVSWELDAYVKGYLPQGGPHRFADIVDSGQYLTELPNSITKSSIRPRPDWHTNIRASLLYWRDNKPETFEMMFGPGTMLHAYANSILG